MLTTFPKRYACYRNQNIDNSSRVISKCVNASYAIDIANKRLKVTTIFSKGLNAFSACDV